MDAQSRGLLRPFDCRDFRTLWAGMAVSLVGDGVMVVALAWRVLALSNTATGLALIGISIALPQVGLALFGGVVSDRFERQRVMIAADVVRGAAMTVAAALSFAGVLQLWHLLIVGACYGAGSAFFLPAFDALVPDLVPPEMLTQANSLDQLVRPLAGRLVGPIVGGIIVGSVGVSGAFGVDTCTFAFSIFCLSRVTRVTPTTKRTRNSPMSDVGECVAFVRSHAWLWVTLLSSSVACLLFLGPSEVLVPFIVRHDLHSSAGTLGVIVAFGGLGAIAAAVVVGRHGPPRRQVTFMYVTWTLATLAIAAYGVAHVAWQLMAACFVFNIFETAGLINWVTMRQRLVPREMLGRIASLDWMLASGLLPVSLAFVAPCAAALGARATLIAAGLLASIVTAAAYFVRDVRSPERDSESSLALCTTRQHRRRSHRLAGEDLEVAASTPIARDPPLGLTRFDGHPRSGV